MRHKIVVSLIAGNLVQHGIKLFYSCWSCTHKIKCMLSYCVSGICIEDSGGSRGCQVQLNIGVLAPWCSVASFTKSSLLPHLIKCLIDIKGSVFQSHLRYISLWFIFGQRLWWGVEQKKKSEKQIVGEKLPHENTVNYTFDHDLYYPAQGQ